MRAASQFGRSRTKKYGRQKNYGRGRPCAHSERIDALAWARVGAPSGENLRVGYDADAVDALAPEREAVWSRLNAATFLSVNEKRVAAGYGAVEDGDTIGSGTL